MLEDNDDPTPTITLTILVGSGGGFVVYDVTQTSRLAFGGNLDETTAYINRVMDHMREVGPEPGPVPTTAYAAPCGIPQDAAGNAARC